MLSTELKHLLSEKELKETIEQNEFVMVCCGRMGPMCLPVYSNMKDLEDEYPNVTFRDMEFDIPDAAVIRNLKECRMFRGLPFTVYYKNGEVVKATASIQTKDQIKEIINEVF